ncbi:MAG: Ada metal-binding domain-containing protein [candidate division WOR-3 bacterium]
MKGILEVIRVEAKTILATVAGVFGILSWIVVLFQYHQINMRLTRMEARVDSLNIQLGSLADRPAQTTIWGLTEGFEETGAPDKSPVSEGNIVASTAEPGSYCASRNSNVFHYPSCEMVQKIDPRNLIWFKTRDEAIRTGKRPCRVCRP